MSKDPTPRDGMDDFQRNPKDPIQGDLPPIPEVDETDPSGSSTRLSAFRSKLSTHRTYLSEHRTHLSEHRTGLSDHRTEMSGRRTGMSFQRTRMSADRTLMSEIRTSLSMISFGFTINQGFRSLQSAEVIGADANAASLFGQALVYLGVGLLAAGIVYHVKFMLDLRRTREEMKEAGLIHADHELPLSLTLVVALLLLLIGIAAIVGIAFRLGPFV